MRPSVAAFFASLVAGISSASAMPFIPNMTAPAGAVHVSGGCGAGFHRTPTGICRRDGVIMAPLIRSCPSGTVRGPRGRCVPR